MRLRLEYRDEGAGKRKVNRNVIECTWGCDYSPIRESYGRCFLPIARTAMVDEYLEIDEYAWRSVRRRHQPYEI